MKKLFTNASAALFAVIFIAACTKNNSNTPTPTNKSSITTFLGRDTVTPPHAAIALRDTVTPPKKGLSSLLIKRDTVTPPHANIALRDTVTPPKK